MDWTGLSSISRRRVLAGLALMPLAVPVAAQDLRSQIAGASVVEEIKKRGVVLVGLSTFVPWAMRDKAGELIGFEVDVARRLADDIEVKLELVPTAFDGIIPALMARKFDLIIGGMVISEKRALSVNFTQPYSWNALGFAAHRKLAAGFVSFADFNKPDVTITTRRGSTTQQFMQQYVPRAQARFFDDDASAFQDVLNGRAHAIFSAEPKPTLWTQEYPDVLFQPVPKSELPSFATGFALRKGDPDALAFFNSWIVLRSQDRWLDQRRAYWFASRDWYERLDRKPF